MMSKPEPILTFVNVDAEGEDGVTLRGAGLALTPGVLAVVEAPGALGRLIADLALGLEDASGGEVRYAGQAWGALSPWEQARCRQEIGVVFQEPSAWLYNLDMDENVTLSARFRGARAPAAIADEAQALAVGVGLTGLPAGRPAWAGAEDRLRCQWVRALLGAPRLLILEPGAMPLGAMASEGLRATLAAARAGGLAVLWLTGVPFPEDMIVAWEATRYKIAGGGIQPKS